MPPHAAHASVRIQLFSFDHWGSALFTDLLGTCTVLGVASESAYVRCGPAVVESESIPSRWMAGMWAWFEGDKLVLLDGALGLTFFCSFVMFVIFASRLFSIEDVPSLVLSTDSKCVARIFSRFVILFFCRCSRSWASARSKVNIVFRSVISLLSSDTTWLSSPIVATSVWRVPMSFVLTVQKSSSPCWSASSSSSAWWDLSGFENAWRTIGVTASSTVWGRSGLGKVAPRSVQTRSTASVDIFFSVLLLQALNSSRTVSCEQDVSSSSWRRSAFAAIQVRMLTNSLQCNFLGPWGQHSGSIPR